MSRAAQIMQRLRAANTVPDPRVLESNDTTSNAVLARILARPRLAAPPRRTYRELRSTGRLVAIAAGVLFGVAVPALAVTNHYGWFDVSNPGEPIDRAKLSLAEASALDRSGFTNDVQRLGERAGVAFYVARSRSGGLCFATGSASGLAPRLDYFVGCQRSSPDAFPSPKQPILDLSPLKTPNPRETVYVRRLVGFAADGVASVGFVDTDGFVHSTPVVNNIYATEWLSEDIAATEIVALDSEGRTLHKKGLLLPRRTG